MTNRAYVMTLVVVLVLAALAQAQTFTSIFSFDGPDAEEPFTGRLAIDRTTGTLYGTASSEGGSYDTGVVFSVTTAGTETVLYNFTGGSDGGVPLAPVIRDSKGNLFGTTVFGGSGHCTRGCGTVFKIDTAGNETVLHSFTGGTSDGCYPIQGLVRDTKGNLYGTTTGGGSSGYGTVFKIDTAGKYTTLHSFHPGVRYPMYGSMLIDGKGNLYGVTEWGGVDQQGTLCEYSSSGRFSVLHRFAGGTSDGCNPYGTPARDGKGNLYGTAEGCGAYGYGTVWKVSSSGAETILYSFDRSDGDGPYAGVTLDKKGNLYGLTYRGGAYGYGVLYELRSSGKRFRILHSFDGSGGASPVGDEVLILNGTLYGATTEGGDYICEYGCGTVWSYVP